MSSWPLLRAVVMCREMTKEMILLSVHFGLPPAVFLEAGIPLGGVVNEVVPGLVLVAQSANVKSMAGGPNVFLDVARIREPYDGVFALQKWAPRRPCLVVLISPD